MEILEVDFYGGFADSETGILIGRSESGASEKLIRLKMRMNLIRMNFIRMNLIRMNLIRTKSLRGRSNLIVLRLFAVLYCIVLYCTELGRCHPVEGGELLLPYRPPLND